ncbi:MAG: DUF3261 domain-containing protein [Pseudomonadales bacterium]
MHNKARNKMQSLVGDMVIVVAPILCLAACGNMPQPATELESERKGLPPLLSSWMPTENFSVYQQVDGFKGEDRYYFENAIEFTSGELGLVMLGDLGQRVATIEYNGNNLKIDRASFLPDSFDPYYVLEAMQMIYWPVEAFAEQGKRGWHLIESDNGMSRRFYYQGKLVAEIEYDVSCPLKGITRYHHKIYDYHLRINSAVIERTDETGIEKIDNERCPL